ncbi:DUF2690 domain-containing protein [Solwaraspora sp. WMMD406]|uniref:helix-turn-helix domain-containing protein n=1 Tax=Solwaraspora sp. WMMD406 TaxID=3016095 RepID=UPI002415B2BC|nr:XRE family transcriptional regulator [Solwaraspora sp. WMMD406]MDG4766024.1 DUF2690 domain-containing protein [Solwaraspora sp. WMMD406]
MGRPERQLNDSAGPIPAFAAELRALRDCAGRPKYAALSRRTGRSQTALSEAAGGRRFPTWETVAAFVEGCDGDLEYWRVRWQQTANQVNGSTAPSGTEPLGGHRQTEDTGTGAGDTATDQVDTAEPTRHQPTEDQVAGHQPAEDQSPGHQPTERQVAVTARRPTRRRRTVSWLASVAVGVGAIALLGATMTRPQTPAPPDGEPTVVAPVSAVADGADPKDSGCALDPDVVSVDQVETSLGRQALGVIELRYSPMCGVAWPRFLPYAVERIPYGTRLHVDVVRPADGARAEFIAEYAGTGTFGNVLHSTRDCVQAEVRIDMPENPDGASAQTACFRGRVREGAG